RQPAAGARVPHEAAQRAGRQQVGVAAPDGGEVLVVVVHGLEAVRPDVGCRAVDAERPDRASEAQELALGCRAAALGDRGHSWWTAAAPREDIDDAADRLAAVERAT